MNLTDPATLRALLDRHGLRARKGLGQHFLCSQQPVQAILNCLAGMRGVLEIGPGPGVLTAPIAGQVDSVVALEIDAEMAAVLSESAPAARVVRQDALAADLVALLEELPSPRAVVSNLPYYITAPLVQKIAEAREHFAKAVLMMQKEVAERFTASAGNSARGSISVYLQALFEIGKVADVPASSFVPPPKVDSTILKFNPVRKQLNEDPPYEGSASRPETAPSHLRLGVFARNSESEDVFFAFVRKGFTQPRKTLANNLAGDFRRESILEGLNKSGLSLTVRPHELELKDWVALAETLVR